MGFIAAPVTPVVLWEPGGNVGEAPTSERLALLAGFGWLPGSLHPPPEGSCMLLLPVILGWPTDIAASWHANSCLAGDSLE